MDHRTVEKNAGTVIRSARGRVTGVWKVTVPFFAKPIMRREQPVQRRVPRDCNTGIARLCMLGQWGGSGRQ